MLWECSIDLTPASIKKKVLTVQRLGRQQQLCLRSGHEHNTVPLERERVPSHAIVVQRVDALKKRINPFNVEHYQSLVKPHWYDR